MCRIASLFLLQRLKGNMSGDACDFHNIERGLVLAQCPGSLGTCNSEETGLPGLPMS